MPIKVAKIFSKAIFILVLCSSVAIAQPIIEKKDGALWVKSATTAEVEQTFAQYNYPDYTKPETEFPRIFLSRLPSDWAQIADSDDKHRTFIRIMLPLVLKINEAILAERQILENWQQKRHNGEKLSDSEIVTLEKMASKYDADTKEQGTARVDHLLLLLDEKVDAVPPAIMVATAGIYSDWGNSRIAQQANNLYLTEVWYDNKGMKPLDDPDADYRYKIYANLEEAIADRALKINSHVNYDYVRMARKYSRSLNSPPYSPQLTAQMLNDSNLHNVAGLIDYTYSFYGLARTDFKPRLRSIK